MKLIFTQPKIVKKLSFCLLLCLFFFTEATAKIIVKKIPLYVTDYPSQYIGGLHYFSIDINEDGINDLTVDLEEQIERSHNNLPCLSGSNCSNSNQLMCQEAITSMTYILSARNLNTFIDAGSLYSGNPSPLNYVSFNVWKGFQNMFPYYNYVSNDAFVFYKSTFGKRYYLEKYNALCQESVHVQSFNVQGVNFWGNALDKYIAFQIHGANGLVYNAWMRKTLGSYEVGYEDIAGYPITVGDYKGMFSLEGAEYNVISGVVYMDENDNCTKDATEKGIPGTLIKAVSDNNTYYAFTNASGAYELIVENSNATYTLSLVDMNNTSNAYIYQSCTFPSVVVNIYTPTYSNTNVYPNKNIGIKAVACTPITLNISSSDRRRCATNVNYINYRNNQSSYKNDFLIKVLLPEYVKPIASVPAWTSVSGDTLFYHLGTLSANTSGQIKIIDSVICWNPSITGKTVCTKAWASSGCIFSPPLWDRSEIKVSGNCMQQKNHWTIVNKGEDMADSAEYRIFYDNVLIKRQQYKLSEGESLSFNFAVNGHTIRIEADQSPYHPYIRYAAAFIEGCGAVQTDDFIRNIAQAFPLPSVPSETISCRAIVDSYDPNDKNGYPIGYGDEHLVEKNTDLTYTIRFQNTGTADAYTVVLADSLSQYLDPLTTEFLGSSHPYRIEYRGGATPLLVCIFDNINLSPESVDAEASQGFVTYRIKQQKDLPDGTVIRNKAHIYFDYNDAIITNTTVHTIGKPYTENVLKVVHEPENISFCKKDHSTALYTFGTGIGTLHYQWKKDGQDLAGSNSDTLYLSEELLLAGNYYCEISNFLDTIKTRTATVVGPMENPVVYAQVSKTSLCPNESVVLTGLGAFSYTWDHDVVDGEAFVPSATKIYTVTGTDPNGCSGTNSLMVEVLESPALEITPPATECAGTPIDITASYTDRTATEGAVTFWKDAGAVQVLENPAAILEEGIYYIRKEANGCADIQPVLVVFEDCFPTGISNHTGYSQIVIYPNPSHDFIMVRSEKMLPFAYKIYSNTGAVVGNSTSYNNQISVFDLPVGSYYLEIHQEETVSRFRFNKQ